MDSIENSNSLRLVKNKRSKYYKTYINDIYIGFLYPKDFENVGISKRLRDYKKKLKSQNADPSESESLQYLNGLVNDKSDQTAQNPEEMILDDISDVIIEDIEEVIFLRAFDKSLDYLSRMEMSASGIRSKLRLKDYSDSIIDRVIDELYARNYLNESRFVESYVRSYIRSKSRSLIERELDNSGIEVSDYIGVIDSVYEDEDITEDDVIEILLNKKFTKEQLTDIKIKRRAMSYLARHGFSYEAINNYLT